MALACTISIVALCADGMLALDRIWYVTIRLEMRFGLKNDVACQ